MRYFVMHANPKVYLARTEMKTPLSDSIKWDEYFYSFEEFPSDAPEFSIDIKLGKRRYDLMNIAACDTVYSKKMINILSKHTFNCEILRSSIYINHFRTEDYDVIHILDNITAIVPDQSILRLEYGDTIDKRKFIISKSIENSNIDMFRDEKYKRFVFVSEKLKEDLMKNQCTGMVFSSCEYE